MARTEQSKEDVIKRMGDIRTLRDQIRVDLHLAGMDLRDEWNKLEKKLPDIDQALEPLKSATRDALDALINDLRRFSERLRDGAQHTVGGIMSAAPASCSPTDSLAQALALMWSRDVGCLPVVTDGGTLVGVLTDRDAAIAAATRGRRMDELRVDGVMSSRPVSCTPDAPWDEALGLMREKQVRRLPVVGENGVVVGMVTFNDVARALGNGVAANRVPSLSQQLMKTLLAVSEPRGPHAAGLN